MLWSNQAHVPQLLSLHSRACEPQPLSPQATTTEVHAPRARVLQQEKPLQGEALTSQRRVAPAVHRESPRAATKTQRSQKFLKFI